MGAGGPAVSDHRRLLEAILDLDGDYPRLYQTSPEFHATIITIVRIMPTLIAIAAGEAASAAADRLLAEQLLRVQQLPEELRDWAAQQQPSDWQEEARGPAPGWKPEPRQ